MFTEECRQAWIEVYTLVASVMKEAAARAVNDQENLPLSQRGAPLSQRMPVSSRMPASSLPRSKSPAF